LDSACIFSIWRFGIPEIELLVEVADISDPNSDAVPADATPKAKVITGTESIFDNIFVRSANDDPEVPVFFNVAMLGCKNCFFTTFMVCMDEGTLRLR
jgi:hypothetical protein